jgi:hypothetical protein
MQGKKKEDEETERDRQLRLSADQEAKVRNLVDNLLYMQLTVSYCLIVEGSEC